MARPIVTPCNLRIWQCKHFCLSERTVPFLSPPTKAHYLLWQKRHQLTRYQLWKKQYVESWNNWYHISNLFQGYFSFSYKLISQAAAQMACYLIWLSLSLFFFNHWGMVSEETYWGPQLWPRHCMFIHLFSKHWVSFQPKLPLGLGVAGYNRIFRGTSAWEKGVMIWGDQLICYRVVGIIKSVSLGMSRRVSGP